MSSQTGGTKTGDPWRDYRVWSIGMYAGPSPLQLVPAAQQPVLTGHHVSDVDAYYVADPFMLRRDELWYMYFEVLPNAPRRGVIGLATSTDALAWTYQGVVLAESFHLSYPGVFDSPDGVFMIPESIEAGAIKLYEATSFPGGFEPVADLVEGQWADPTVFFYEGLWWLFACVTPFQNRTLHLFFAEQLRGPWRHHPRSPIVVDNRHAARPSGRVRVVDGRPIRFAQDCEPRYGFQVRAFEILELSPTNYRERECAESPVLVPSDQGWNDAGMHHMDAHQLLDGSWLACVDGDTYDIPPGAQPHA